MQIAFNLVGSPPGSARIEATELPRGVCSLAFTSNQPVGAGGVAELKLGGVQRGRGFRLTDAGAERGASQRFFYLRIDSTIPLFLAGLRFTVWIGDESSPMLQMTMIEIEWSRDEAFSAPLPLGRCQAFAFNPERHVVAGGAPREGYPPDPSGRIIIPPVGSDGSPAWHVGFTQLAPPGVSFIRMRASANLEGRSLWYLGDLAFECHRAPSDELTALAGALPSRSDNPIGKAARAVLVSKMKRSLQAPYQLTPPLVQPATPDPQEFRVDACFESHNLFYDLAVAVIAARINRIDKYLAKLDRIQPTIDALNQTIRGRLWRWYVQMLGAVPGPVKSSLDEFSPASLANAREDYIRAMTLDAWLNARITMSKQGTWQDPEWELYHHWTKLVALGAAPADIDRLIGQLVAKGLPVPDSVGAGKWMSFLPWWAGDISTNDVADCDGWLEARIGELL